MRHARVRAPQRFFLASAARSAMRLIRSRDGKGAVLNLKIRQMGERRVQSQNAVCLQQCSGGGAIARWTDLGAFLQLQQHSIALQKKSAAKESSDVGHLHRRTARPQLATD